MPIDLQQRIDKILSVSTSKESAALLLEVVRPTQEEPKPIFSIFVDEHLTAALDLATNLIQIAKLEGLDTAVSAIEMKLKNQQVIGLVQHAIKIFLTHHPEARKNLRLKALEVRQPNLMRSSQSRGPAPANAFFARIGGATAPEDQVSFWREDPLINEHHEHWHLVYPSHSLNSNLPFPLGHRHGELFAYMHEQMLARYDAERIALGLGQVTPFLENPVTRTDFLAPIPEGYDPGLLILWDGNGWYQYGARPSGAMLRDSKYFSIIDLRVKNGNALFAAGSTGMYNVDPSNPAMVTIDTLGNTVEANSKSVDFSLDFRSFGNLHNNGHNMFARFESENPLHVGVMNNLEAAVRDPIFFRWHKFIDNIFDNFQKTLPPHDFTQGPKIRIRKTCLPEGPATSMDIILCRASGLPASIQGNKFGSRTYNQLAALIFGHSTGGGPDPWDTDFSKAMIYLSSGEKLETTDVLLTEMLARNIKVQIPEGTPELEPIQYLSHEDFYYFIRVQNMSDRPQTVAVRIFLSPEEILEDRRAWIELDRFVYSLKGSERAVIFRPADQSSVVRKPALKPADLTADDDSVSPARDAQPWCDCGWPYTLLLPRGTKDGMKFRLLVMFSSGDDLTLPDHPECCTAISYCGLQDLEYPDKKPMGYPFDRKFSQSIPSLVPQLDNWAWRTITIRCKNL